MAVGTVREVGHARYMGGVAGKARQYGYMAPLSQHIFTTAPAYRYGSAAPQPSCNVSPHTHTTTHTHPPPPPPLHQPGSHLPRVAEGAPLGLAALAEAHICLPPPPSPHSPWPLSPGVAEGAPLGLAALAEAKGVGPVLHDQRCSTRNSVGGLEGDRGAVGEPAVGEWERWVVEAVDGGRGGGELGGRWGRGTRGRGSVWGT